MGFSLFARRYSGYHASRVLLARTYAPTERNSYCSLFLRVLRCFTSPGSLHAGGTPRIPVQNWRVSLFGYLRIKGYKPPPRSFSQVSRVLHSRPRPRHPPCTLMSLMRNFVYHNHYLQSDAPRPLGREAFNYLCIFVCQTSVSLLRNENRPQGRFSCALCTRAVTAYPLLKNAFFGS